MTTPGEAKASGESPDQERDADQEDRADRDTVELDASTLSRLRQFDAEVSVADRDTVELSAAESQSLARHADRSSPLGSGEAPLPEAAPPASGEEEPPTDSAQDEDEDENEAEAAAPPTERLSTPPPSIRSLTEGDAEGDRSSMLTIPAPPKFDEEA